jgi:hypothetical protein
MVVFFHGKKNPLLLRHAPLVITSFSSFTNEAQSTQALRQATLSLAKNHLRFRQPNYPDVHDISARVRIDTHRQLVALVNHVKEPEVDCTLLAAVMSNIYSDVGLLSA